VHVSIYRQNSVDISTAGNHDTHILNREPITDTNTPHQP